MNAFADKLFLGFNSRLDANGLDLIIFFFLHTVHCPSPNHLTVTHATSSLIQCLKKLQERSNFIF